MIFWPWSSLSSSSMSTIRTYPFETFLVSLPLPQRYFALSHSLPHPAANSRVPLPPGPACQSLSRRVARALATFPCSPARLCRECALPPPTAPPRAIPAARSGCRPHAAPPLLLPPPHGTPGRPPCSTSLSR
jgi:hypothetical protein